jgi:citrate lyase beta subunit
MMGKSRAASAIGEEGLASRIAVAYVHVNIRGIMSKRASKPLQRPFPWREPLLTALRRNPKMVLACKAANISRNTAYTHLRKDARFRRQWERAFDRGLAAQSRAHDQKLRADPHFQRVMQRARDAWQSYSLRLALLSVL